MSFYIHVWSGASVVLFSAGAFLIVLVYSALRQRMASASRGRSHAPGELESPH